MHARLSRYVLVMLSFGVIVACNTESSTNAQAPAAQTQARGPKVNADAQVLVDFKSRIDKYMELHNRLKKESPPLKETKEPAKIKASQEVLAMKIREARKDAKQGDIFTPEIRQQLRRLMYPETKGTDGKENKAAMAEEKGELKTVTLKVNADYPDSAPLMTVAPDILAVLPKLPEDLEYRFVAKHMILLDVHANLIVDYVLNAIQ